jgi:hypothetical protein
LRGAFFKHQPHRSGLFIHCLPEPGNLVWAPSFSTYLLELSSRKTIFGSLSHSLSTVQRSLEITPLFLARQRFIPVIATAISIAAVHSWPTALNRIAHLRFVQWLGEISYPLYSMALAVSSNSDCLPRKKPASL